MRKVTTLFCACLSALGVYGQQSNLWTPVSETTAGARIFETKTRPAAFKLFRLDEKAIQKSLQGAPLETVRSAGASAFTLSIPNADGDMELFRVVEAPVMEPQLSARHPEIKSYAGQGITVPGSYLRFSVSPIGFHAMVLSVDRPTYYISPANKKAAVYMVAARTDMQNVQRSFECLTRDLKKDIPAISLNGPQLRNADDAKLRTFRLAIAASGEFSQFWLDGTEADDNARRAKVLAAQNMLITRCNGIFEKDFSMRVNIIANNTDIIYLDATTDPWPGAGLNAQTQLTIDAEIGNGNYDVGHLVTIGGNNGNAGCVGCVCNNPNKGSGFTSLAGSNWNDDLFVIDFLPHEIGHQFDGAHTFSHGSEAPSPVQVEPGSGTTIMGYAGITGPVTDVAAHSHDNFHAASIQEVTDYIKAAGCAAVSNTGNNIPTANAGSDYTIPFSTPFKLTGSGADADGEDALNFVWEQMDVANAFGMRPSATQTAGPVFRCFSPTTSTSRTFPALASILDGTNGNTWEVLPSVGRSLNFRFTVRDNRAGGGGNRSDDMVVTVNGSVGPFAVTAPNSATTWCPGNQTVTWSVNGSNTLAANVNILLSYDGGNSFPVTLSANTPNDGSEAVNIPCTFSNTARIKVEAVGNIFFDISNANFMVGDNTKPTFTVPANVVLSKDASCNYNAAPTVTGDVSDEADNCSSGFNATYADATGVGSCPDETIITRTWTLTDGCGNSTVKVQTITIKDVTPPTFTAPANTIIYKDANCNYNANPSITGDVTDEADNCDNTLNATYADAVTPGSCIGEEIITRTWTLTDDCGNSISKVQTITAKDNTPPVISNASASPASLWPPNHRMVLVNIGYSLTDNCSPPSAITSSLIVSSNEPVNGNGDGNTTPDWIVVDNHTVWLRAERAGPRNSRVYTITINATDDCGNAAIPVNVQVRVEHDRGNSRQMMDVLTEAEPTELIASANPNPTQNSFSLFVYAPGEEPVSLMVTDMLGRVIERRQIASSGTVVIGSDYRPGMYVVSVVQGKLRKDLKLMKTAGK